MSMAPPDFYSPAVWPDLYALLEIAPDANTDALRTRIRQAYLEAVTNADHRNIQRRDYYAMMGQRIAPQAQRILLDERTRLAYDRQLALHRNGDASAIPYTQFVARLSECESESDASSDAVTEAVRDQVAPALLPSRASGETPLATPATPAKRAHPAIIDALLPTSTSPREPDDAISSTPFSTKNPEFLSESAMSERAANAQNLFELAHEVLRSEKKYAEMSHLPSLSSDAAQVVTKKDAAPQSEIDTLPATAFVSDAPFFDELPVNSSAMNLNSEQRKTLFPTSNTQSSTRSRPTSADTKVRIVSSAPNDGMISTASPSRKSVSADSVSAKTVFDAPASTNAAVANAAVETVDATTESTESQKPNDGSVNYGDVNNGNAKIEQAGSEVPILAKIGVAEADIDSAPAPLSSAELQARAEWAAAQSRVVSEGEAREIAAQRKSDVVMTPEENEARRARVLKVERGARPLTTSQLESSGGQDLGAGFHGIVSSGRDITESKPSRTRIRIEEGQKLRRTLPQTTRFALTAVLSAGLMFLILRLQSGNSSNATSAPPALQIEYSNELQPVMQSAQSLFAKTPQGRGLGFDLRPTDSQSAMRAALSRNATSPDIWIPAEGFWSERFDRGAARQGQTLLGETRSLAMSPLVLIARDDKAAPLLRRFRDRKITSWDALRGAIGEGAVGHFGMSDPQKSGAGALVRLFMAREWCKRNNLAWDKNAFANARLWSWLNGFENNVPDYGDSTDAMIQDLVMGNSDRFWWAIGYECDAIKWLKQGKSLQVFYLPQTAFAEYPFCALETPTSSTRCRRASTDFQTFLRSREVQIAFAQNGFRPTEIRLADVPNNPFRNSKWRARGLRENGFRVDQRFNLELLDALTAAWKTRN